MDHDDEAAVGLDSRARFGLIGSPFLVRHRFAVAAVVDVLVIAFSVMVASVLRYEFDLAGPDWVGIVGFVAVAGGVQLAAGLVEGLYMGGSRFGSFDEVAGLVKSIVGSTLIAAVLNRYALGRLVPVSVSLAYGIVAIVLTGGARYSWRLFLEQRRRPDPYTATKVLVYGAGDGGQQLVSSLMRNPSSPYLPVGLLDDDPLKANLRLVGVRSLGPLDAVASAARATGATALVVAIPSAEPAVVRRATKAAEAVGLSVLVMPAVEDLLARGAAVTDLRPVTEEDLLGRGHIDTDIESIAGYLTGKRVLVTGAGGSIGSELCRQITRFAPAELIMLDRDESLLHAMQLSIDGRGQLETPALVVADIRDRPRMEEVFGQWQPEVVFHTAALKHVPLLEMHPQEGYKTNVVGTQNLLDCAAAVGVERFVNISTDKAADPANVLGRTKREAELRTAEKAADAPGTYMSVRFGNVLGSRGSVLTAFREQIAAGGPVTVTDPAVTRYFMTIGEAVQLVIQAGAVGADGEVLILDMGEPVLIADVATRMIAADPADIEIVYTGLREGEKLHEVLLAENEAGLPGAHPLITHVHIDVATVRSESVGFDAETAPGAP